MSYGKKMELKRGIYSQNMFGWQKFLFRMQISLNALDITELLLSWFQLMEIGFLGLCGQDALMQGI